MNTIKNSKYLKKVGLIDEKIELLEQAAQQYQRHANISFKVLSVRLNGRATDTDGFTTSVKFITVEVRQGRNSLGKYLSSKELVDRTKDLFSNFMTSAHEIHVRPKPYQNPPPDEVDPDWVQERMNSKGVSLKQMEKDTGLDKTNLSAWVNGKRPMSQPVKAMFYYYFYRL